MATHMAEPNVAGAPRPGAGHQRVKSSVLKSFMHRRNQSDGSNLPAAVATPTPAHQERYEDSTPLGYHRQNAGALGELQQNQLDSSSPRKSRDERRPKHSEDRGRSPTKSAFSTLSLKTKDKDAAKLAKSREPSPTKPKKTKSATNLAGLLSRPKSFRNLSKMAKDEEIRQAKDKENRSPPSSVSTPDMSGPPPPIYAQFCGSQELVNQQRGAGSSFDSGGEIYASGSADDGLYMGGKAGKERPKSFQPYHVPRNDSRPKDNQGFLSMGKKTAPDSPRKPSASERVSNKTQRPKIFTAFSAMGYKTTRSQAAGSTESAIDPKDVDTHLEAMLDRRNIPENQRYKMRNLADTIKMEFIRQDWAEMAAKAERPGTNDSNASLDSASAVANGSDCEDNKPKRTRGKSFTLSRGKKDPASPTKKSKGEGTVGRHFRSKSSDSIVSDHHASSAPSSPGTGILSKIKLGQGPGDFVSYLRKVQKPELVEVGKLHKLRLLLRNETVTWTEDFIKQGGMKEVVGLLNRIMEVEWREEHEDALLHEDLLCLKALCTTALALQYLHSIHTELFPKLLHMLFDPEKKGPSEFTTRNIITSVLFKYIESATPQERGPRAQTILAYLRDPEPKEDHVPFVLEMRRDRPYRVWNKEAVSVTKEVFWIFLHNLNVVTSPNDKPRGGQESETSATHATQAVGTTGANAQYAYMLKHFPQERPPVAAAPYVGGVEWDATNYLASHLDLMNAIIACTPSAAQRNALRGELRISGWERCLGGSLRLCKEKFYGCVHEGLRTWVAAAVEDGWDVRDVRYGPPPESRSPPKKSNGQKKKVEAAPRIDMPKLDFGLDAPVRTPSQEKDVWLS